MKYFPFFLFIFTTLSSYSQQHVVGVTVGVLEQVGKGHIDLPEEPNAYFSDQKLQFTFGLYYRKRLAKYFSLEIAPQVYQETINANFTDINISAISQISNINLYVPVLLRTDLGHQLSAGFGLGSILFLQKKRTDDYTLGINQLGKSVFSGLYQQLNNWPIQLEVGISYGLKRFCINGKYVYKASATFNDLTLDKKLYPVDFKSDFFQLSLSYQLFEKSEKQ